MLYTLEENRVQELISEGDPKCHAYDEVEQYKEEFYLRNSRRWTSSTNPGLVNLFVMNNLLNFVTKHNNQLIENYMQYQSKESTDYVNKFDSQYSDISDEEQTFLIDEISDSGDVYSQHKFDNRKTRQ